MGWRTRIATPVVLALCGIGFTAGSVAAKDKPSEPDSKAYGKSLSDWMELYFERLLSGDTNDMVERVRLLAIPAGVPAGGAGSSTDPATFVGSLEVTLKPTTPFVLPVAAWFGESYNTGQQDDAVLPRSIFTRSNVLVTMDGTPIIDSGADNLRNWYFGPEEFEPPIVYPPPRPPGSISANFVQGLGFVHGPLNKGVHTLKLKSEIIAFIPDYYGPGVDLDIGVKYDNTWTITVKK